MQGIFHRGFMDIHAGAARLLDQPSLSVFRGEGGEIERRPNKPTQVWLTQGNAEPVVEDWPMLLNQAHQPADEVMDLDDLLRVWRGEIDNAYATAAITGTLAIALRTMGKANSIDDAEAKANALWQARNLNFLPANP